MTSEPVCDEAISAPVSDERMRIQPFSAMAPSAAMTAPAWGVKRRQLMRPSRFDERVHLAESPLEVTFQSFSSRKLPLARSVPSGLHASERITSECADVFAETAKLVEARSYTTISCWRPTARSL